jgi:hypothetical protein
LALFRFRWLLLAILRAMALLLALLAMLNSRGHCEARRYLLSCP